MRAQPGVHGPTRAQAGKRRPQSKKERVGDTPEDSRLQGLQAQCNGTQSLSWEDP